MPLTCNIDAKGARVRRIWGIINIVASLILTAFAYFTGPWWLYLIAAFSFLGGLFAFYEAKKKWCVMRAMGVKTPL